MSKLVNGLDLSKLQKEAAHIANNGQGHVMLLAGVVEGLCQILQTLVGEESKEKDEPLTDKIHKKIGEGVEAIQAFIDQEATKKWGRPAYAVECIAGFALAAKDQMMGDLWVDDLMELAADYTVQMIGGEIDLTGKTTPNG